MATQRIRTILSFRAFHILSDKSLRDTYDRQRKRSNSSDVDSDYSEDEEFNAFLDSEPDICDTGVGEPASGVMGAAGAAAATNSRGSADEEIFTNLFYTLFMQTMMKKEEFATATAAEECEEETPGQAR